MLGHTKLVSSQGSGGLTVVRGAGAGNGGEGAICAGGGNAGGGIFGVVKGSGGGGSREPDTGGGTGFGLLYKTRSREPLLSSEISSVPSGKNTTSEGRANVSDDDGFHPNTNSSCSIGTSSVPGSLPKATRTTL